MAIIKRTYSFPEIKLFWNLFLKMLFIKIFIQLNDNWLDFVFSITYEWVQQATVFVLGKPFQPSEM
jgi:hypothetical protein